MVAFVVLDLVSLVLAMRGPGKKSKMNYFVWSGKYVTLINERCSCSFLRKDVGLYGRTNALPLYGVKLFGIVVEVPHVIGHSYCNFSHDVGF